MVVRRVRGSHRSIALQQTTSHALREIAAGKVHFDRTSNAAVEEWIEHMNRSGLY